MQIVRDTLDCEVSVLAVAPVAAGVVMSSAREYEAIKLGLRTARQDKYFTALSECLKNDWPIPRMSYEKTNMVNSDCMDLFDVITTEPVNDQHRQCIKDIANTSIYMWESSDLWRCNVCCVFFKRRPKICNVCMQRSRKMARESIEKVVAPKTW